MQNLFCIGVVAAVAAGSSGPESVLCEEISLPAREEPDPDNVAALGVDIQ